MNPCAICGGPMDSTGLCIRACYANVRQVRPPKPVPNQPLFVPLIPVCPKCCGDRIARGEGKPGIVCTRCAALAIHAASVKVDTQLVDILIEEARSCPNRSTTLDAARRVVLDRMAALRAVRMTD